MKREKVSVIDMDQCDIDYIQFLSFEQQSYQNILDHILLEKQKGYEYSLNNYNHFMNEYKEALMKYQIAFSAMLETYAPDYKGNNKYSAVINFDTKQMEIFINIEGE